jgi:hypothetical protein
LTKAGVLASLRFLFAKNRVDECYGDFSPTTERFPIDDVPGMAKATFFGLLVGYLVLEKSSDCGALIEAQDDGLFLACRNS